MAGADLAKTSERVLKAVVVGPSGVGKSALVRAWEECQLPSSLQPTDGAETRATQGNTLHKADLHFHELGDEASESEVDENLADADVVVLVYDRHRPMETLGTLESVWLPRVERQEGSLACSLLIANKAKVYRDLDAFLAYISKADAVFEALPCSRKERLFFCGLDDVQEKAVKTRGIVYKLACAGRNFAAADDQPRHQEGEAGEENEEEVLAEAVATIDGDAWGVTQARAEEMEKALAQQVAEAVRVVVAKAFAEEMAKVMALGKEAGELVKIVVKADMKDGKIKVKGVRVGVGENVGLWIGVGGTVGKAVGKAVKNAVENAVGEAVKNALGNSMGEARAVINADIVVNAMARAVKKATGNGRGGGRG